MLSHVNPGTIWLALVLVVTLLFVRRWRCTGPYELSRVVPRGLTRPARVAWRSRPFFGWCRSRLGVTRFAFGTGEDSVAIVGPPRVGKTAGVLIPQALMWDGPLISTSTKPDVLRATAGRRLELAREHGGDIYVYAPTAAGPVEGLRPIRWSPLAGCDEPRVAALRVEALITVAQVGQGMENADHWRSGAARILRPYLLAASNHRERPGDFALVRQWLSTFEFREPLGILAGVQGDGGRHWAAELQGVMATPERERGSFFSAAMNALKATADPAVLRSCAGTDLDVDAFLRTRSTLYVVSPSEHQEAVAPLIAALIESLVTAAYAHHREGRLPAPLLLSLDELTNIAPLPSLESIVSQGAGQGVLTSWAVQSHAQLRQRYGEHTAEAIWSATRCKVVFGGLADGPALEQLSRMIGDHRVRNRSVSVDPRDGLRRVNHGHEWRPRVTPAELRGLPPRWALLLYHHHKPRVLRADRGAALAVAPGIPALAGGGGVMDEDVLITEDEWQAVLVGARVLRQVGVRFEKAGSTWMAMECEAHADALEDLGQRAVVAAARGDDVPDADREAER